MKKLADNNNPDSMESDVVAKLKNTGEYGVYEKYRKGTYKAKTIWYEDNIVGDLVEEDDVYGKKQGLLQNRAQKNWACMVWQMHLIFQNQLIL